MKKELEFLNNFFLLQKARLPVSESIQMHTNITWDGTEQLIAPLIVLPFIENAYKYGVSIDYPCFIAIDIQVQESQFTMHIKNRIIKEREELKGNNTGMANSKKRLELLYPGKHTLTCVETETDYEVNLSLTLK